jgi:hypothetical protein
LAASVAVVARGAERNPVQSIGIALLVGAIGYLFGILPFKYPKLRSSTRSGWWLGDLGCFLLILGIVFMAYYAIVASICRHIILPIMFRIAGVSDARIPSVFEGL